MTASPIATTGEKHGGEKPQETGGKGSAARFQWDDPLLLEDQLTEDERMIRDGARAYARKAVPRVLEANRHEKFHREIMNEMGEMGFLGATLEGYGCAGVELCQLRADRARGGAGGSAATARPFRVQSSLVMYPIWDFGSEAQRQKYLPKLRTGEWVGCFGLTEPDAGSDPARCARGRSKVDGGYRAERARRPGSPTRRSPMCSWSGPRTTRATSAASCSRRA